MYVFNGIVILVVIVVYCVLGLFHGNWLRLRFLSKAVVNCIGRDDLVVIILGDCIG